MNFRFPGLHCRNTGSPPEGCFFSPVRQLRMCFIGPEQPRSSRSINSCEGYLFIYSRNGSTMVLPSQLQPAKAIWPKAEARSARMAWERRIEALGIWARGWSREQHTDNQEEPAARSQLRDMMGAAANGAGRGEGGTQREEPCHQHRA